MRKPPPRLVEAAFLLAVVCFQFCVLTTERPILATLLTAALALLPVGYLYRIWPLVLALVPTHWSPAGPDHFMGRVWLWNMAWLPAVAFVVLTFLPQVQAGQRVFWSSPRQRLARLVVVAVLAGFTLYASYQGLRQGRAAAQCGPATR